MRLSYIDLSSFKVPTWFDKGQHTENTTYVFALGGVPNPLKLWPLTSFKLVKITWFFSSSSFSFSICLSLFCPSPRKEYFCGLLQKAYFLYSVSSFLEIQFFLTLIDNLRFPFTPTPITDCFLAAASPMHLADLLLPSLRKYWKNFLISGRFPFHSICQQHCGYGWAQLQLETARSQDCKYQTGLFQPSAVLIFIKNKKGNDKGHDVTSSLDNSRNYQGITLWRKRCFEIQVCLAAVKPSVLSIVRLLHSIHEE